MERFEATWEAAEAAQGEAVSRLGRGRRRRWRARLVDWLHPAREQRWLRRLSGRASPPSLVSASVSTSLSARDAVSPRSRTADRASLLPRSLPPRPPSHPARRCRRCTLDRGSQRAERLPHPRVGCPGRQLCRQGPEDHRRLRALPPGPQEQGHRRRGREALPELQGCRLRRPGSAQGHRCLRGQGCASPLRPTLGLGRRGARRRRCAVTACGTRRRDRN